LRGALGTTAMKGIEEAVAAMEAALKRHRLRS